MILRASKLKQSQIMMSSESTMNKLDLLDTVGFDVLSLTGREIIEEQ